MHLQIEQGGVLAGWKDGKRLWSRPIGDGIVANSHVSHPCRQLFGHNVWRKDKGLLQKVCLEGIEAVIFTANKHYGFQLVDIATGNVLLSHVLGASDRVHPKLVRMEFNKVAVLVENILSRRSELMLYEVFTEHRVSNQLELIWKRNKESNEEDEMKEMKIYGEAFALPIHGISDMAFTVTSQMLTPSTLLMYVPEDGLVYSVAHQKLSARRPLPPSALGLDEMGVFPDPNEDGDALPYDPVLNVDPAFFVDHEWNGTLQCIPTQRESATRVVGLDELFRPAHAYDSLPAAFSKQQVSVTVFALLGAAIFLFYKLARDSKADALC